MSAVVLRAGAASHVGRMRSVNQDAYLLLPDRDLFIVADGMGGHQGGEVAARLAIETLQVAYRDPTADSLTEAIAVANHRIRNEGDADPDLRGMGTTIVALVLVPDEADPDADDSDGAADADQRQHLLVANVGDSRAYLHRDGGLVQLTEDHSVVADLVREGRISSEEAEVHPQRNIVTRVLGVYETVDVDLWPVDPVAGDRILLASDGLFNEVGADQIASVLRRLANPAEAADELVRLANEGGGRDNITAVVVDVVDDGGVAEAASAALAGGASGMRSTAPAEAGGEDLAGFTSAMPVVEGAGLSDEQLESVRDEKPTRSERRAERRRQPRSRLTWRVVAFVLLLAAVIGGALATIQWYGTSTYYVAFTDDEVVIYRGRPGGILWVEPELERRTGIDRNDVPQRFVAGIEAGNEQPSRAGAERLVDNIEQGIDDLEGRTTTTQPGSTTTTTGPTTTTRSP